MNKPAHLAPADQTDFRARFTAAEYLHMGEAGAFDDMKVELIDGGTRAHEPAERAAYAQAGIPNHWVVDGERRVIHVFAEPVAGDYVMVSSVRLGAPLPVPGGDRTIVID